MDIKSSKICVLGLGYVGLPLAIEFGKKISTVGYDIDESRVKKLTEKVDQTNQITEQDFIDSRLVSFTSKNASIEDCNIYIVTVPTPVDENFLPDLTPLISASRVIGSKINRGDIVVYESTVYPGATEEVCVPLLEQESGLIFNQDFYCGYSPERINPGDKINTLSSIVKVVSGSNDEVGDLLSELYSLIVHAGVHKAPSIRVAEASKVIENVQRDVNIALVNELSMIFSRMNISTLDVIKASSTKWNFVQVMPGLVGGHCIGVDPYYLTYKSNQVGYTPDLINASRRINENMSVHVVDKLISTMTRKKVHFVDSRILVMGFTFKEDCGDLRNTKVLNVVKEILTYTDNVDIYDPVADQVEIKNLSGIKPISQMPLKRKYDAIIIAVPHKEFLEMGINKIHMAGTADCVFFDLKGVFPNCNNHITL